MVERRSITKKIGSLEFNLLSPNEIRKMSATKVITADTYDDDGFPIPMGLMDPRLGVIEPGLRCKTCGLRVGKDKCPGHFGHIDLAMPVIHVGLVKTIRNCLRSTCRDCGRILITDKQRDESKVRSGFGKNISNWIDRDMAYPTNVLHLATECNNRNHSAAFPEGLPEWFIKLFTKEGDTVLDPFMGSGTTNIVASRMKRNSIGIEIVQEYYEMVKEKVQPVELYLLEPKTKYERHKSERGIAIR